MIINLEPSTTERLGLRPGQRVRALGDVDTAIRGVIAETGDFACLVRWDGQSRPVYVFSLDLIVIPALPKCVQGISAFYAEPPGYHRALCAECAQELVTEDHMVVVEAHPNWENPELYCDSCGERCPSEYAEPEASDGV